MIVDQWNKQENTVFVVDKWYVWISTDQEP